MPKTVLIAKGNGYSARANRLIWIFIGIMFIINGTLLTIGNHEEPFKFSFGVIEFLFGLYALFYSIAVFSTNSKLAPRVKVDSDLIEVKKKMFGQVDRIEWDLIDKISFDSYSITFTKEGVNKVINYDTTSEVSIEIKEAIRETADAKGIEVIGG